jgi:hypothetical protein
MNTDKPTREELLEELESIRLFLTEDDSGSNGSIPLLTQTVGEHRAGEEEPNNVNTKEDIHQNKQKTDTAVEPNQIQEPKAVKTLNRKHKNTNQSKKNLVNDKDNTENPFLPPHIRKRLSQNKDLISEIQNQTSARVEIQGDLLNGFSNTFVDKQHSTSNDTHHETIIDELVAEYLPEIEAKLRTRLKQKLQESE